MDGTGSIETAARQTVPYSFDLAFEIPARTEIEKGVAARDTQTHSPDEVPVSDDD